MKCGIEQLTIDLVAILPEWTALKHFAQTAFGGHE